VSGRDAAHRRKAAGDLERAWGAAALKMHLWGMVEYDRVLYLDADTIVLRPMAPFFQSSSLWKRNFSAIYEVATESRIFKSGLLAGARLVGFRSTGRDRETENARGTL
jgi:alpha-N-acetylglucosamine transferase